jgi:hypothetical protein
MFLTLELDGGDWWALTPKYRRWEDKKPLFTASLAGKVLLSSLSYLNRWRRVSLAIFTVQKQFQEAIPSALRCVPSTYFLYAASVAHNSLIYVGNKSCLVSGSPQKAKWKWIIQERRADKRRLLYMPVNITGALGKQIRVPMCLH